MPVSCIGPTRARSLKKLYDTLKRMQYAFDRITHKKEEHANAKRSERRNQRD